MAMIHVARDGANLGSFPSEEVQEGLRTGKFRPTDMGWQEGMTDWQQLGQMLGEKPGEARAAETPGTITPSVPNASESGMAGSGLPWEHRQELGLVKAFFDTVTLIFTQPNLAFSMMKTEGDLMSPILFAVIGGSAGVVVSILFQIMLHSIGFMADRQAGLLGMGLTGIWAVLSIIFVPAMIVLWMFIVGAIFHLSLMLLGGAKKPFETTLRVVCFSAGSTYLLCMVPFCGGMIASVWNIVLECLGLARAHQIDTGKAVLAVLLPIIVCCGGMLLFGFFIGGLGALSQMSR